MTQFALAALVVLPLSTGLAFADTVAPSAAALSPFTATRLGNKPRNVRAVHCAKKADGIGLEGNARAIYLRKCGIG